MCNYQSPLYYYFFTLLLGFQLFTLMSTLPGSICVVKILLKKIIKVLGIWDITLCLDI